MYADHAGLIADEVFKLIGITNRYVIGGKPAAQERFHHAKPVWDILSRTVGICLDLS